MGGRKTVPKRVHTWLLALFGFGMLVSCSVAPILMPREQSDLEKASELFHLALQENDRLKWDECLAMKAFERAKWIYEMGDFSDERIGKPWDSIRSCFNCRNAAQNLARGKESAEKIHKAWKKSDSTRKNLSDIRFSLIGVGCYETICVELFAGF